MIFIGFNFLINNFLNLPIIRSIPLILLTFFIYPLSVIVLYLLKLFTILVVFFYRLFENE